MESLFCNSSVNGNNHSYPNGVKFLFITFVLETSWGENSKYGYVMRFGVSYLVGKLIEGGHQADIFYCPYTDNQKLLIERLRKEIEKSKPDFIGFSVTSDNFWMLKIGSDYISRTFDIPVLVGGPHAIIDPQSVMDLDGVDGVCLGEGETPMLTLANLLADGKSVDSIAGFYFKGQKVPASAGRLHSLDELPYPNRDIYQERYSGLLRNGWVFQSHRGCLYRCAFCSEDFFKKKYKGEKYVRSMAVDNLIAEIDFTIKKYPSKMSNFIGFSNPTFNLSSKWLREFSEKYGENINMPFGCDIELSNINEEIARMLAEANCREAWIGFESGNDFIRKNVLRKNLSTREAISKIEILQKRGIKIILYIIVGVPYETEQMIKDTYTTLESLSVTKVLPSIFLPYPGTVLGELCYNEGWAQRINKDNSFPINGYYESILNYPHITKESISEYKEKIFDLNRP